MVTRDVELGTSGYGSHGRRMRGSPVLIYTWMDSDGYDIYICIHVYYEIFAGLSFMG